MATAYWPQCTTFDLKLFGNCDSINKYTINKYLFLLFSILKHVVKSLYSFLKKSCVASLRFHNKKKY